MRPPSQTIQIDRERKLVDVRCGGFFSPEDVSWTGEEVRAAVRTLGPDAGRHVTLYDLSEVEIAPQATVELIHRTFDNAAVRALWARRLAFVTPSTLLRRQVERLRDVRPDIGIFETREAALAWLLD